jgi:hypothetical protein
MLGHERCSKAFAPCTLWHRAELPAGAVEVANMACFCCRCSWTIWQSWQCRHEHDPTRHRQQQRMPTCWADGVQSLLRRPVLLVFVGGPLANPADVTWRVTRETWLYYYQPFRHCKMVVLLNLLLLSVCCCQAAAFKQQQSVHSLFCSCSFEHRTMPCHTGNMSVKSSRFPPKDPAHEGHTAMVDSKHQFRDTRGTSRAPVSMTLRPLCFLHP